MSETLEEHEISMILSSSSVAGAQNISSDGSRFEVELSEVLTLPRDALNPTISCDQASIWWSVPNITTSNNKIFIHGYNTAGTEVDFDLTIPTGLYNLNQLNTTIQNLLENEDAKTSPLPNIELVGNSSTQKVEIKFNYDIVEIDFTISNSCRAILGFNSAVLGPYSNTPKTISGDTTADMNPVNSFLLHTNLVDNGIALNGIYNNTIAEVLINVQPGSQILYEPYNAPKVSCHKLKGGSMRRVSVSLTDNENNAVDTDGEIFSLRIVIRYKTFVHHNHY